MRQVRTISQEKRIRQLRKRATDQTDSGVFFLSFFDREQNSAPFVSFGQWELPKPAEGVLAYLMRRQKGQVLSNNPKSQAATVAIAPIVGRALIVSNDSTVVEQLTKGMHQFAIAAEVCSDASGAATLINIRKFEAIIVDPALGDQVDVLERIRLSPSNGNSVTFAVVDSATVAELKIQPNFIIPKPLDKKLVGSVLKAALGLIIRDYRRYFRCPIAVPVLVHIDSKTQIPCEMMNISEGGLAVSTTVTFDPCAAVKAEFVLPNVPKAFNIDAEICWCDKKGRAGLHFRSVMPDQLVLLQDWLSRRIEQGIPEPVARLFRKVP